MIQVLAWTVLAIQTVLTVRFFNRVRLTMNPKRISGKDSTLAEGCVSVIVPVYNEADRIEACLEALAAQGCAVREILVVDGGSSDDTPLSVQRFSRMDRRIRLISAYPVPDTWNGKAWGLEIGLRAASSDARWVATIDADVRCMPSAIARVVSFAEREGIPFLSIAAQQVASTPGLSLFHPSLLTMLAYRFGIPGHVGRTLSDVQSNGQFAVYERKSLLRAGGFRVARRSICEDVTLARHLFLCGYEVGFYEGNLLAKTEMYSAGVDCLRNWPRSLSLRDQFRPHAGLEGMANIVFLQVIPVVLALSTVISVRTAHPIVPFNRVLIGARLGVLAGTRRAYADASWTYWLSPLVDPISAAVYLVNLLKRNHSWRGRQLVNEDM